MNRYEGFLSLFTDPKAVKRWKVRDALANIRWRALA